MHLGCGAKRPPGPGWINVDLPDNTWEVMPDVSHDLTKPLPFPDEFADEVHSYHVVEHFYHWQLDGILADWRRVLKPGGVMVLECPCFDKIRQMVIRGTAEDMMMAYLGLYGSQKSKAPAMVHRWCYSWRELEVILRRVGFEKVMRMEPLTHKPARDMRFEAVK